MASKLGTVFVELSLDDKVYKKQLSETLISVKTTAKGIETSWKALGAKSDAVFDAQRRAAQNAFTLIKNSAQSTANDIVRAEQAKAAKITAINEQQYGRQISFVDKLKANWIAGTVAITASIAAIGQAWAMADESASYLEKMQLLDAYARSHKTTASSIINSINDVSGGMIKMSTSADVAYGAMAKGLSTEMIIGLARAASVLNEQMGTTVDDAFRRLSEALETNKQKSLKLAVGLIDLESKFGKAAGTMSEARKQIEFYKIIMEKTNEVQTTLGGGTDSISDKMEKLTVTLSNLKIELGVGIIRASAGALAAFEYLAAGVLGLVAVYSQYRALVYDVIGDEKKQSENTINANAAWEARNALLKQAEDHFSILESSTQDLTTATASSAGAFNNQAGAIAAVDDAAKRLLEQWEDTSRALDAKISGGGLDTFRQALIQSRLEADKLKDKYSQLPAGLRAKAYAKIDAGENADDANAIKKAEEAALDAAEKRIKEQTDLDKKLYDDAVKLAKDRLNAERDVYKDLRGYGLDYYDATIKIIDDQASAYRKLGVEETAVAAWVKEEHYKAEIEKLKASDKFFDGWKAGMMQMERDAMTWGSAGEEMFKSFAENSQNAVSDILFDGMKGKFRSFEEYFQSFTDTILRKWTDTMAQMAVEWAMGPGLTGLADSLNLFGYGTVNGTAFNADVAANFTGSGLGFKRGGVFNGGSLIPFANGGIVNSPTVFPMAQGMGLMGESGPEAVMPLKRMANGDLGIQGGNSISINVPITMDGTKQMASELRREIELTCEKVIGRHS